MIQCNISSHFSMVQYEEHSVETGLRFLRLALISGSGYVLGTCLVMLALASLGPQQLPNHKGEVTYPGLLLTAGVCKAWFVNWSFSFPTFNLWWVYRELTTQEAKEHLEFSHMLVNQTDIFVYLSHLVWWPFTHYLMGIFL